MREDEEDEDADVNASEPDASDVKPRRRSKAPKPAASSSSGQSLAAFVSVKTLLTCFLPPCCFDHLDVRPKTGRVVMQNDSIEHGTCVQATYNLIEAIWNAYPCHFVRLLAERMCR